MTCAIFIQARMGSTRLPGKVLRPLGGIPVLEHVLRRVRASNTGEPFVLTSVSSIDLPIVRFCAESGTRVFCGSEEDVLDRFWQLARLIDAETIVRITADCPILDPSLLRDLVRLHMDERTDYASNSDPETFPDGLDCEVFTKDALERAWRDATLPSEREHVTPYIRKHPDRFRIGSLRCPENLGHMRWTLDTESDLTFLETVVMGIDRDLFGMHDVLDFLSRNPEVATINAGQTRNEGLLRSIRKDHNVE